MSGTNEAKKNKDKKKEKQNRATVIEMDASSIRLAVNEAVESLIAKGELVRDMETGEIIDPDDSKRVAETIEKNKKLGAYKLKSKDPKKKKKSEEQ